MTAAQGQNGWRRLRGGWTVIAQVILGGLVMFGPRRVYGQPAWPFPFAWVCLPAGSVLMLAGGVLFLAGLIRQGRSLTASPCPKERATLLQNGPYALVRHPMYSGLLALAFGWALVVQSWLTLAFAVALFALLDSKARHEERWLTERFPAYRDYRRRVRRLVPFIY